jgi:hypothetical protein
MSYSRYRKIPTLMLAGSAAIPSCPAASTARAPGEVDPPAKIVATVATMQIAAPLISHFSCCRRSPAARRQASACRPTKHAQHARMTGPKRSPIPATCAAVPDGFGLFTGEPVKSTWRWDTTGTVD